MPVTEKGVSKTRDRGRGRDRLAVNHFLKNAVLGLVLGLTLTLPNPNPNPNTTLTLTLKQHSLKKVDAHPVDPAFY